MMWRGPAGAELSADFSVIWYVVSFRQKNTDRPFQQVGESTTKPIPFVQSLDDFIESFHSRVGFSRERMGLAQAMAFDQEAKKILLKSHSDGTITFQVTAHIVWGLPRGH
jgi:hypothetical protein